MTCVEIRDILSDLIDVRNGEIPPLGASRLAEPGMRADAESHLAACSECRTELALLEDIGSVFADFSVGELPAQHFSDYGEVVRRRMKFQSDRKIIPIKAVTSRWWKAGAATAAAACLAFATLQFLPSVIKSKDKTLIAKAPRVIAAVPKATRITPINYFNDLYPAAAKTRDFNPEHSKTLLDELQNDESKYGYLIFRELPLLGIELRTMRDVDRDVSGQNARLGLRVHSTIPDGVANEMGLMRDDVIRSINGLNIDSGSSDDAVHFMNAISNLGKGAAITIVFARQDKNGVLYIQRSGVLGEPKATYE